MKNYFALIYQIGCLMTGAVFGILKVRTRLENAFQLNPSIH